MKRYIVTIKEVHEQDIFVSANTEEEAVIKARGGDGDYGNGTRFQYTIDEENWTVEED
jgi:hypothetical protein